jgi:chromate transporter
MPGLFQLFWVFFKIGAFTFGGGYAMIPLIQDEVCKKKQWSSDKEFLDIVAIAQSLPGALVVNVSTMLGYKLRGVPGLLMCVLGAIIPSFISILLVAVLLLDIVKYTPGTLNNNPINNSIQNVFKGVRPAVAALIAFSAVKLGKQVGFSYFNLIIGTIALILLILKVNPVTIIVVCGILGVISEVIGGRHHAKSDN